MLPTKSTPGGDIMLSDFLILSLLAFLVIEMLKGSKKL